MFLKRTIKNLILRFQEVGLKKVYDEVHATRILTSLSPLINGWTYLPFTDWAPGPQYYAHICNDILINQKQSIVEIGSGISTIIIARLIKKNNINTRFISIDQNKEWQTIIAQNLEADGIRDTVKFIYAPLTKTDERGRWYDMSNINFGEDFFVDTLIVDGPIVDGPRESRIRYGAVPYFLKFLSPKCYTIYLHDTDRNGELEILQLWTDLLQNVHIEYGLRYAILYKGTNFCFSPQNIV